MILSKLLFWKPFGCLPFVSLMMTAFRRPFPLTVVTMSLGSFLSSLCSSSPIFWEFSASFSSSSTFKWWKGVNGISYALFDPSKQSQKKNLNIFCCEWVDTEGKESAVQYWPQAQPLPPHRRWGCHHMWTRAPLAWWSAWSHHHTAPQTPEPTQNLWLIVKVTQTQWCILPLNKFELESLSLGLGQNKWFDKKWDLMLTQVLTG